MQKPQNYHPLATFTHLYEPRHVSNQKDLRYKLNNTGRDTYIYSNNGGFSTIV